MKLDRPIVFKLAKGYRGRSKNCYSLAVKRVMKGLQYAYRDRRTKKRDFRTMWIQQIQAGTREYDVSYSHFMNKINNESGIAVITISHNVGLFLFSFPVHCLLACDRITQKYLCMVCSSIERSWLTWPRMNLSLSKLSSTTSNQN